VTLIISIIKLNIRISLSFPLYGYNMSHICFLFSRHYESLDNILDQMVPLGEDITRFVQVPYPKGQTQWPSNMSDHFSCFTHELDVTKYKYQLILPDLLDKLASG
jgi:hypothetical protein